MSSWQEAEGRESTWPGVGRQQGMVGTVMLTEYMPLDWYSCHLLILLLNGTVGPGCPDSLLFLLLNPREARNLDFHMKCLGVHVLVFYSSFVSYLTVSSEHAVWTTLSQGLLVWG